MKLLARFGTLFLLGLLVTALTASVLEELAKRPTHGPYPPDLQSAAGWGVGPVVARTH